MPDLCKVAAGEKARFRKMNRLKSGIRPSVVSWYNLVIFLSTFGPFYFLLPVSGINRLLSSGISSLSPLKRERNVKKYSSKLEKKIALVQKWRSNCQLMQIFLESEEEEEETNWDGCKKLFFARFSSHLGPFFPCMCDQFFPLRWRKCTNFASSTVGERKQEFFKYFLLFQKCTYFFHSQTLSTWMWKWVGLR